MKKVLIFTGIFLLCLSAYPQWDIKKIAGNSDWLSCVFFPDSLTGYVSKWDGDIIKSVDGGITWSTISNTGISGTDEIFFTSNSTGFAVGASDRIYKTSDGGLTWTPSNIIANVGTYHGIFFINDQIGYAVGPNGTILKSVDYGLNWSSLQSDTDQDLWALNFINADTGIIVGNDGVILKTTDGGTDWIDLSILNQASDYKYIKMISNDTVFVAGQNIFASTYDGGTNWNSKVLNSSITTGQFINSSIGYLAGGNDLFSSVDGGQIWKPIEIPFDISNNTPIQSLYFSKVDTGFIVGPNGYFILGGDTSIIYNYRYSYDSILTQTRDVKYQNTEITISPSPAENYISVDIPVLLKSGHYSIYNIQGTKVMDGQFKCNKNRIDISCLQKGIYILKANSFDISTFNKFIKN